MLPQPPWLVFTTGNSGRATDAFRLDAVDYLLKPLDPKQVAEAVNRLLANLRPFESNPAPLSARVNSVTTTDKTLFTGSESDLLVNGTAHVREQRGSGKASHGGHGKGTELLPVAARRLTAGNGKQDPRLSQLSDRLPCVLGEHFLLGHQGSVQHQSGQAG